MRLLPEKFSLKMNKKIVLFTVGLGLSLTLSLSSYDSVGAKDSLILPHPSTLISQVDPLAPEVLKNSLYEIPNQGAIALSNGTYQSQSGNSLSVTMADHVAYGDLKGDGSKEAAVLLAVNTGESSVLKYLAIMVLENGKPMNTDTILLGDRVSIKSLSINNGKIRLKMLTHSPTDPLDNPSQEMIQVYALNPQTEELTPISLSEAELDPNTPQVEVIPAPALDTLGIGDNLPWQPPEGEIEFRF